jgi:hypothetical protein
VEAQQAQCCGSQELRARSPDSTQAGVVMEGPEGVAWVVGQTERPFLPAILAVSRLSVGKVVPEKSEK